MYLYGEKGHQVFSEGRRAGGRMMIGAVFPVFDTPEMIF